MFRFLLLLALVCASVSLRAEPAPAPAPAHTIPLDHFLDTEAFGNLKISPDGEHLAATVPYGNTLVLVILRREDMKQTAAVKLEDEGLVNGFWWANDRQVVYTVATRHGPLDKPVGNPFLYVVDVDGDPRVIKRGEAMWLVDLMPEDPEHIRVSFGGQRRYGVGTVNLDTGKVRTEKVSWPANSVSNYYLDNAGRVRGVLGYIANELYPKLWVLDGKGEWHQVNDENAGDPARYIAGFSADNRTAYVMAEQREGTDEFLALDLESMAWTRLFRNPRVDASRVLTSPVHRGVIAVVYLDGKPRLEYVLPDDPHARALRQLGQAFPDSYVYPTSYTADGKVGLYLVASDVNSGEYYLVDHAKGKAAFVAARSERLDPRQMSPTKPVRFEARDGRSIEGFLTVPRERPAGQAGPLVLVPHGGPIGVYDQWGFDTETQLLASRGYAVMTVNFRGSGNYGRDFRHAGHRQWGRKMQDDLTDATRWALAEGIAAPGRICLYGASYGAYAAMMGLAREPDLYACGIGNVGVYDLPQLYREETVGTRAGQVSMDQILGKDGLAEISPPNLARQIRVPVLLGAGAEDYRAPVHHTRTMNRALRNAGVPVDMVVYQNEGHGYYDMDNRRDWASRVLELLDKTIGRSARANAAPAPAAGDAP